MSWKLFDWDEEDTAAEAAMPDTLGNYRLLQEIGRGAMGVVYVGEDQSSGRRAAIKALICSTTKDAVCSEQVRSQFLREARTLAWLHHPGIVHIYDVGEEQGITYIAMEIVQGAKLSDFVDADHLLPLPQVLDIIARVADALGYADEQHIAHRDIKPGNILYDAEHDSVKLVDFGISRTTHGPASLLRHVQGSPRYMSPEQVLGNNVDGRSDLFSLGIVLQQLVCGQVPFDGGTDREVMQHIVEAPPLDLAAARPGLPPCLCDIIKRALQKDKAARYANGYQMAAALRACAATLTQ